MPDWHRYVRENLCLAKAVPAEEADAVNEIARQLEDAYLDALNMGLSSEEAEREAKLHVTDWEGLSRELSGIRRYSAGRNHAGPHERNHRMNLIEWIEALAWDVRYAMRRLRKAQGFTVVAVLTLALGIGANSAIFSAINALLLNPISPFDADRIVAIRVNYEKLNIRSITVSPTVFADIRDSKEIFAAAGMGTGGDFNYNASDLPEHLFGQRVTWQWFDVFGAKPILGRLFTPEEDQPNANRVVILEYRTWQRLFGADRSIIEKTIQLNQQPYKVVGVMGPEFPRVTGPALLSSDLNLWTPLGLPAPAYGPRNRFNESYQALARLRPGVSFQQASAFVRVLTDRVLQDPTVGAYAKTNGWSVTAKPYVEFVAGDLQTPMFVLMGAVGFVLLIACSNIAGLKLARASGQSRELAVRIALGANRWRLVRQTIAESALLTVGGSVLGIMLAYGGIRILLALAPTPIADGLNIRVDTTVMAFTALVGVAAGILFGIAPAWQITRADRLESLKEGGRGGTASRSQIRLRSALVVLEVAIALVLLVGSGLFLRSLIRLQEVDTGFESDGVMTGIVTLPLSQYREPEKQIGFYRAAVERLEHLPGVTSAAAAIPIPFLGDSGGSFNIEGTNLAPGEPVPHGSIRWVTPGYFSSLQIPLKRGRTFSEQDTTISQPVVVIDENLAQQYWPNKDPIGQRLRRTMTNAPWLTIIGVVGHVRHSELAADSGKGVYYIPIFQQPPPTAALVVKTTLEPTQLSNSIREAVRSIDPAQAVFELKTMNERVLATLGSRRFAVNLLTLFASIAVLMAALGLYGVISYTVTHRTHEIGIRMALGAYRSEVLVLVIKQGMRIALAGIVVGVVAAFLLARVLSNQLYQISSIDPMTFGLTALMLLFVALLASFIPARRATRVDPYEACRYE